MTSSAYDTNFLLPTIFLTLQTTYISKISELTYTLLVCDTCLVLIFYFLLKGSSYLVALQGSQWWSILITFEIVKHTPQVLVVSEIYQFSETPCIVMVPKFSFVTTLPCSLSVFYKIGVNRLSLVSLSKSNIQPCVNLASL